MMNERKNAKQLILRGNDRCAICFLGRKEVLFSL